MKRFSICLVTSLGFLGCAPSKAEMPASTARGAASPNNQTMEACVVQGTELQMIDVEYDAQTGDTLIAGNRFSEVHPEIAPPYARAAPWFVRKELLSFRNARYEPYALPRVISPLLLERIGEFNNVPLFAEVGAGGNAEIIYVPVRPGCEFQQYVQLAPY